MRATLAKWLADADALEHVEQLGIAGIPPQLDYLRDRKDDFYIALVGELFERLHHGYQDPTDWSRLGDAFTQTGRRDLDGALYNPGVLGSENALFAAAAFYFGGYPASAYLALKAADPADTTEIHRSCFELLARPSAVSSATVREVFDAVRRGHLGTFRELEGQAAEEEARSLQLGPDEWVGWRLFRQLLSRFASTNIRAVLPHGDDPRWDPLVRSLVSRTPPVWDFFPSQIDAVRSGLLESVQSFSLQMPTGAGKTALAETLLFHHHLSNPEHAAVLLVPYRSLASELRGTLVRRLNGMGVSARCAYGGTVPTGDEVRGLDDTRVVVATPESFSSLLSISPEFFRRITLVICDEGHLLDGAARGVALELLLARIQARECGAPRFVFISAIVPNIEEINDWLGGTEQTVVRSDYRPALAEFSRLQRAGSSNPARFDLWLHPQEAPSKRYSIEGFLGREDFQFPNALTGRTNTYSYTSLKTRAIATARKVLPLGAVAVFAANKRGNQGAVGLAHELLFQLEFQMRLPSPVEFVPHSAEHQSVVEYLAFEFGPDWVGTRAFSSGAVLHHGDVPQETREVLERSVREGDIRFAICTNTLAEGVNLPIRSLVLYSVQRRGPEGSAENLLVRDIKNLVGRAGRAGATTKGLVVCVNPNQWNLIEPVAKQQPGERVSGALLELMKRLLATLREHGLTLTNDLLEASHGLHALVDGIDATLIDLAVEQVGEDELVRIASDLSARTFAARQADPHTTALMQEVFSLRARRIAAIKSQGRLEWISETGTRARMLDAVEAGLLPKRERWDDISSPIDPDLIKIFLAWVWTLPEMEHAVSEVYRDDPPGVEEFAGVLTGWLNGDALVEIARAAGLDIDDLLSVHSRILTYTLHVAAEQGVSLLGKLLTAGGQELAQAVVDFPDHIRFGVPTVAARALAARGVRHRRAAVVLGTCRELRQITSSDADLVWDFARDLVAEDNQRWLAELGTLVFKNTLTDLGFAQTAETDRPSGGG